MHGSPPKPRLSFHVGVVGHRPNRMPPKQRAKVAAEIGEALERIAEAVRTAHRKHQDVFEGETAGLTLLSGLAEGADRMAATHALEQGYALTAILPFDSDDYANDFADEASAAEYENLLARAGTVLTMPGARDREALAYGTAGLTLVDNADILIGVWDGGGPAGWGGTTDLMEHAARQGVPILYVDATGKHETRLLWSGFASFPGPAAGLLELPDSDLSVLDAVVDERVSPPAAGEEREKLRRYLGESWRPWNFRIELPVFLASLLLRPVRKTDLRPIDPVTLAASFEAPLKPDDADVPVSGEGTMPQTAEVQTGSAQTSLNQTSLNQTSLAYGWADALGIRYGQTFRGAYTSNFICAALAVLAGVASLVVSDVLGWTDWVFAAVEVALLGYIFVNTRIGQRRDWHTRWREAREVAERLRAAELLFLVALPPSPPGTREGTWTAWYANAQMRGLGLVNGAFDWNRLDRIKETLMDVGGSQCAYHGRNSVLMRGIETRIESIGYVLFGLALLFAAVNLIVAVTALDLPKGWDYLLMGLIAALPALGAATFGIRLIGDYEGVADRDDRTEAVLSGLLEDMRSETPSLPVLRSSARSIADTMLGDLSHWRITTETRKLVEPA